MRVLITGVSGTGKSSLVQELRRRGYTAFDADDDGFTAPLADGTWGWLTEPIRALLDEYPDQLVFFAGCSDEQATLAFDFKVLLTAPPEVIVDRLRLRTTNPFGNMQAERDRVLTDMRWVLPLLRASADIVIDSTSINDVADIVVDAVSSADSRPRRN